jgi:hypothetical protein
MKSQAIDQGGSHRIETIQVLFDLVVFNAVSAFMSGGFVSVQGVCSDHLETASQKLLGFKQPQDAADHPRHPGNAGGLAKAGLVPQAVLQFVNAFPYPS